MKRIAAIIFLFALVTLAQAQDASRNAKRLRSGTAVPTMICSPGPNYTDVYIRTTTGVHYTCTAAPNTWTADGGGGSGTVTSIATTGPITGGTITTTGTIACATCVTSAASLTSTALMSGAGSQGSQTPSATTTLTSGGMIQFGGTSNSFAGVVVSPFSATHVAVRKADDSAYGDFDLQSIGVFNANDRVGFFGLASFPRATFSSEGQITFADNTTNAFSGVDTSMFRSAAGVTGFGTGSTTPNGAIVAAGSTFSSATVPITFSNAAFQSCTTLGSSAGGVLTCAASTAKVKQRFQFFDKGLSIIRKIQPQTFQYRPGTPYADGSKTHLGLIAENLKAANPLLASATGAGMLQPEPMAIAAIQIAAIKELDARVTKLETENKRLRRQLRRRR